MPGLWFQNCWLQELIVQGTLAGSLPMALWGLKDERHLLIVERLRVSSAKRRLLKEGYALALDMKER